MHFSPPHSIRCQFDVTPLLGIMLTLAVFLLAAVSFAFCSRDESIRLPGNGQFARPPATPVETPVTLQLTGRGTVILDGAEMAADVVRPWLEKQRDILRAQNRDPARTTIILRADGSIPTGKAQDLIEVGQQVGFQRFVLRASAEDARDNPPGRDRP